MGREEEVSEESKNVTGIMEEMREKRNAEEKKFSKETNECGIFSLSLVRILILFAFTGMRQNKTCLRKEKRNLNFLNDVKDLQSDVTPVQ